MDSDLYDEFGNYVGPELDSDDDDEVQMPAEREERDEDDEEYAGGMEEEDDEDERAQKVPTNPIVLHEDKKYYATTMEISGENVESSVQEEDVQPLIEPIINSVKQRRFAASERNLPATVSKYFVCGDVEIVLGL